MSVDNVDIPSVEKSMIEWINDWSEGDIDGPVDTDTNLVAVGALDSMGLTGLIAYMEEAVGVEFDFDSFDPGGEITVHGLITHCLGSTVTAT